MYGDFPTYVIKVVEVCFSFARLCCKTFYPLIWIRSGYIKQLTRLLRKRRRQRIKLMAQNSLQKLVLEKWVGTIPAYFIVNFVSLSMRSAYCFIMLVIEITHCARSAVQISHQNKVTAKKTLITSDICMMFTHEPSLRGRRSEGVKRAVNSSVKVHCWDLQISHSGAVAIESRSFLCFTPAASTVYKTFSRSKNYLLRKQTLQR